ncbi:unnamed protein product [Brachionus calyciflorus]|uniref:EF-hand domain-containing protein n=1 Tax=Brachionus calyciflorus TaxID=104777 RepID=A0A814BZ32_9BILA|nr:unnamed protein product [Brachionus calyciflorus]
MNLEEFRAIAGIDNLIDLDEFIQYEKLRNPSLDEFIVRENAIEKFALIDRDNSGKINLNEFNDALKRIRDLKQKLNWTDTTIDNKYSSKLNNYSINSKNELINSSFESNYSRTTSSSIKSDTEEILKKIEKNYSFLESENNSTKSTAQKSTNEILSDIFKMRSIDLPYPIENESNFSMPSLPAKNLKFNF